jgi:membrane protease YdiL (CAAX protease family)
MDPRRFGAMHAILAFVLLLVAQLASGFIGIVVMVVWAALRGADLARDMPLLLQRAMVPLIIASAIGSAVVTLALTRLWAWHLVKDRSRSGLGLFVPRGRDLALSALAGLLLGALYIAATQFIPTTYRGGPMAQMATSSPVTRAVWAVLAVLIAPPVEELLFRGLMLRGMLASWGVRTAGIVVTLLFFALHLFETAGYWPSMVAILMLSVATLAARLRTGSIVSAMALHAAYNATLVFTVYATALIRNQ